MNLVRTDRIGEFSDKELIARLTRDDRRSVENLAGRTPKPLLSYWRVRYGLHLLAIDNTMTVARAAIEAGFHDSSHFSRATRKEFGYSPLQVLNGGTRPNGNRRKDIFA